MENEMLDQMHKKLVWKITIQFIWILCITAMIVCIIYEGIMQVHRNHVWALGGMALILLITYFIWNLHTLWELFENKTKVENELERSSTLIHCVTELSANQDIDEAINHLLEIIVSAPRDTVWLYYHISAILKTIKYCRKRPEAPHLFPGYSFGSILLEDFLPRASVLLAAPDDTGDPVPAYA